MRNLTSAGFFISSKIGKAIKESVPVQLKLIML